MKLAISNIAWKPEENDSVVEVLHRHAVQGLEVAPTILFDDPGQVSKDEANKVRARWESRGFPLVAMQALLFGHPELTLFVSAEERRRTSRYLKSIVSLAGMLGAGPLVFGSPKNRQRGELPLETALDTAARFFHELAEVAEQHQTILCIEPNAPQYGCDFITNTEEAVDLVRAVDHPGFGLHLDAGVMALNNEAYEESLERAFPYMRHFHISEPFLERITQNRVDHARLGGLLASSGYQGWVSIEMKSGPAPGNAQAVAACLEFALRCYH